MRGGDVVGDHTVIFACAETDYYRDHFTRNGWDVMYRNRRFPFLAALVHKPPKFLSPLTTKGLGRLISYALMEGAALLFEPCLVATARRCDVVYLAKVKSLRFIMLTTTQVTTDEYLAFCKARPDVNLIFVDPTTGHARAIQP